MRARKPGGGRACLIVGGTTTGQRDTDVTFCPYFPHQTSSGTAPAPFLTTQSCALRLSFCSIDGKTQLAR